MSRLLINNWSKIDQLFERKLIKNWSIIDQAIGRKLNNKWSTVANLDLSFFLQIII